MIDAPRHMAGARRVVWTPDTKHSIDPLRWMRQQLLGWEHAGPALPTTVAVLVTRVCWSPRCRGTHHAHSPSAAFSPNQGIKFQEATATASQVLLCDFVLLAAVVRPDGGVSVESNLQQRCKTVLTHMEASVFCTAL